MPNDRTPGFRPLRILLVEDDFSAGEALRRLIRRAGHEVQCAAGLEEVRGLPDTERFDLLISDFNLGGSTGPEVLEEVGRRSTGVVAIALSGSTDESALAGLQEAGFAYYFTKPVDWPKLRGVIEAVMVARDGR